MITIDSIGFMSGKHGLYSDYKTMPNHLMNLIKTYTVTRID